MGAFNYENKVCGQIYRDAKQLLNLKLLLSLSSMSQENKTHKNMAFLFPLFTFAFWLELQLRCNYEGPQMRGWVSAPCGETIAVMLYYNLNSWISDNLELYTNRALWIHLAHQDQTSSHTCQIQATWVRCMMIWSMQMSKGHKCSAWECLLVRRQRESREIR